MQHGLSVGAVVLAAGAGSRYSGDSSSKLLARLDGQPILVSVLEELRRFGTAATTVVLGVGAEAIEASISWRGEVRVRNPDPGRGIASSLKVGIDRLRLMPTSLDGAFIVLGDQPLLRAEVMAALTDAAARARPADRSVVVPRYDDDDGPSNPVLLLRPAWDWVDECKGDRGLGPIIAERPEATLVVPVSGRMPDIDTTIDLERLRNRQASSTGR